MLSHFHTAHCFFMAHNAREACRRMFAQCAKPIAHIESVLASTKECHGASRGSMQVLHANNVRMWCAPSECVGVRSKRSRIFTSSSGSTSPINRPAQACRLATPRMHFVTRLCGACAHSHVCET